MWGHMQHSLPARWSVSLRAFVTAVMFVALAPLLAHALLSTWSSHVSTRAWAEADLVADAELLARQLDTRLELSHRTMRLLAGSAAALRAIAELRVAHLLAGARTTAALQEKPLIVGPRLRPYVPAGSPLAARLLG